MTRGFDDWLSALEARHLRDLRFREVSKALRALSATYVERRHRVASGGALSGAGKRAAFALFYAPLHYLLVEHIVRQLGTVSVRPLLVDLGCGTGAAGAAWASVFAQPRVLGVDRHPWAAQEAAWTYRQFGLTANTVVADAAELHVPRGRASFVSAFTLNELPDAARRTLLSALIARTAKGDSLLIVEPIAKSPVPWWGDAQRAIADAGGRSDEWRFRGDLPPIVRKLDTAAGLRHDTITGRSLFVG